MFMSSRHSNSRYARPAVEVEFANQHIQHIDGFDFVEAVIRFCGVISTAMFTVSLQRVRTAKEGHTALDDPYEIHPYSGDFISRPASQVQDYWEYRALFLTRGHSTETGTVSFSAVIQNTGTVLVDAKIRFDSRYPEPVCKIEKGHLAGLRFLPYLRSPEERTALNGRYPVSVEMTTLFPLDSQTRETPRAGIQTPGLFEP